MQYLFPIFVVIFLSSISSLAQQTNCSVGGVAFACPSKYFREMKVSDQNVRVFKYQGKGENVFLFMAGQSTDLAPPRLVKLLPNFVGPFEWNPEGDPLVMEMNTKYKHDSVAALGLSDKKLIEVKTFTFDVDGEQLSIGYVSDWTGGAEQNRKLFADGAPVGDNAAACNAVVTALNSVTKEFKEKQQYCSLTMFTAPK